MILTRPLAQAARANHTAGGFGVVKGHRTFGVKGCRLAGKFFSEDYGSFLATTPLSSAPVLPTFTLLMDLYKSYLR